MSQHVPSEECELFFFSSFSVQSLYMLCIGEEGRNESSQPFVYSWLQRILLYTCLPLLSTRRWIQGTLLSICSLGLRFLVLRCAREGSGRYA